MATIRAVTERKAQASLVRTIRIFPVSPHVTLNILGFFVLFFLATICQSNVHHYHPASDTRHGMSCVPRVYFTFK